MPRGSGVERQLREDPPSAAQQEGILVQTGPTDPEGNLEAITGGEVVLSVPGSESLEHQRDDIGRTIRQAGTGSEPLVIVVQAAELLRDEELAPVLAAAERARRPVILRIIRPSER